MSERIPNKSKSAFVCLTIMAAIAFVSRPALALLPSNQDQTLVRLQPHPQSDLEAQSNPVEILAAARVLQVCSRTGFVKSEVIENELLKRADFQRLGLLITKDIRRADLVMEVRRSNFTTEYPYVVIDLKTRLVVASGRVNSLFGTAAGKIAKGFTKQLQRARTPAATQPKE